MPPSIDTKLNELFLYAGDHGIPLYVLIDEYDHFANTVLAHRGAEAYQSFTHGGFYRNFFATLKAGAGQSDSGIERLFITGVSPITMDDVTSGFNIGRNISLEPEFNDMLGDLLELYRDHGAFHQEVETALAVMREWYNGYRFAKSAEDDLYVSRLGDGRLRGGGRRRGRGIAVYEVKYLSSQSWIHCPVASSSPLSL